MTIRLTDVRNSLHKLSNKQKAKDLQWFFKTGKGEYGEGDIFIGVVVPKIRAVAREFSALDFKSILELLKSPIHEERLLALLILVSQFENGDPKKRKQIYDFYLKNTAHINNWDLVDLSSHHIVGVYLLDKSRLPLYKLAKSKSLWDRRISVISTFEFIRNNQFTDCLKIAKMLIQDKEDLIQKAVGWMLREIGKRDLAIEESFLKKHYHQMPRTMLRYAIEKFPDNKRQAYLKGTI